MSTPTAGRTNSVRQQLDELDVLLQRMLSLPISALEEGLEPAAPPDPQPEPAHEPADPEPAARQPFPGGPPADRIEVLSVRPVPAHPEPTPDVPAESTRGFRVDPVTALPTAVVYTAPPADAPADTPADPLAGLTPPAPTPPTPKPKPAVRPRLTTTPPTPILLLPLAGVNAVFDWSASWFGPPGRFLTGPVGKNLIGWCGLAMLTAAAVWGAADYAGWTQ